MNEYDKEIVGFCGYCNHEIYLGEDYIYQDNVMYHLECNEIRNRFCDPFDIDEEEN